MGVDWSTSLAELGYRLDKVTYRFREFTRHTVSVEYCCVLHNSVYGYTCIPCLRTQLTPVAPSATVPLFSYKSFLQRLLRDCIFTTILTLKFQSSPQF
ncbi:hypothetical protein QL285_038851 [Trifolium repens]|nr:hypothetical protein QL285_038851 [Trifolium repens]